jgi:hypothetical protein
VEKELGNIAITDNSVSEGMPFISVAGFFYDGRMRKTHRKPISQKHDSLMA